MNDNQATASAGLTRRILLALAIFLIVVGAKLVVIERSGTDLPFWDQWAKEGELMHAPWLERGELWSNLFVPHNEHRIAPTLAANLALVATTGQWDARVQSVISGGWKNIHDATAYRELAALGDHVDTLVCQLDEL